MIGWPTGTGNRKKQFVLTFESFCLKPNRLLSCLQIPGFSDRKRFGAGALKNFHYDWAALAFGRVSKRWQLSQLSSCCVRLLTSQALIKTSQNATSPSHGKLKESNEWGPYLAPVVCVAHLPVPADIVWKSLVKTWDTVEPVPQMGSDKGCTENWFLSAIFPRSLLKA